MTGLWIRKCGNPFVICFFCILMFSLFGCAAAEEGVWYDHSEDFSGYARQVAQLNSVFQCHHSQFPEGCADAKSISLYLKLRAVDFGIRSGKGCAEGFRVLGVTHMHCFPESGN